jgi:hypothetical protein
MGAIGLAASGAPPVLQEAVDVQVGEQRADDALNAKGNFRFERSITGWRSGSVLDLRRKE